ncbi:MFS general substrate transporter, partial [Basidiobolus meristosporus CBS 931.73]
EIDVNDWQYKVNLLFSVTSLPNVIFPFISGILIDKIGSKFALILFTTTLCIGHALFAFGISVKTFWIMCLGRTLFGIGSGSAEIVQNKLTTDWFRGSLLAFALALNLTFDRWAAAGDAIVSPRLFHFFGNVPMVTWFGLGMCLVSAFCSFLLIRMDTPRARIRSGVNLESKGDTADGSQDIKINDILNLKPAFWLLCVLAVTLYGSVQPFLYISSDYLQSEKYPGRPETAGTVMSIPSLLSSFGTPLCGLMIDRVGHHSELMTFSALVVILVHGLLAFTSITPVLPYIMLGFGYSLFAAALWPSVPSLVHERQLGTGIGISVIAFNLSITGVPMVIARIRVWTGSFFAIQLFFMALAFCGLLAGLLL